MRRLIGRELVPDGFNARAISIPVGLVDLKVGVGGKKPLGKDIRTVRNPILGIVSPDAGDVLEIHGIRPGVSKDLGKVGARRSIELDHQHTHLRELGRRVRKVALSRRVSGPRDLSAFEIEALFNFSDAERRVNEDRRALVPLSAIRCIRPWRSRVDAARAQSRRTREFFEALDLRWSRR